MLRERFIERETKKTREGHNRKRKRSFSRKVSRSFYGNPLLLSSLPANDKKISRCAPLGHVRTYGVTRSPQESSGLPSIVLKGMKIVTYSSFEFAGNSNQTNRPENRETWETWISESTEGVERAHEREREREGEKERGGERQTVGPKGGNFNVVTGFMSFPPFGGFHFQPGLLELVIQTRPRNECRRRRRRRRRRLPLPHSHPLWLVTHADLLPLWRPVFLQTCSPNSFLVPRLDPTANR